MSSETTPGRFVSLNYQLIITELINDGRKPSISLLLMKGQVCFVAHCNAVHCTMSVWMQTKFPNIVRDKGAVKN